ncbi:hypothetical protein ANO14919_084290 [Xylariales sp. No.14919]|nr:hypothetical protein ANO14919_084290 [Xylariales sp. No.14919]
MGTWQKVKPRAAQADQDHKELVPLVPKNDRKVPLR